MPGELAYAATKGAVEAFTLRLALRLSWLLSALRSMQLTQAPPIPAGSPSKCGVNGVYCREWRNSINLTMPPA
jgi:hypothetical protein